MRRLIPAVLTAAAALAPMTVHTTTAHATCTPEVAIQDAGEYEGSLNTVNTLVFTVDVAPGCAGQGQVAYRTKDGNGGDGWATAHADYTPVNGVLQVGQEPLVVKVPLSADQETEKDEAIEVELYDPQGVVIVDDASGLGTVFDDDSLAVSLDGGKICWEPEWTGVELHLTSAAQVPVTVKFHVSGGTALAGVHYEPVREGTVTIPAGSTTGIAVVRLLPRAELEPDKYFVVEISDPSAGTVGTSRATVTLRRPA
ncbi:Calx-beta domain-containing protein [Saccharothrix carnea]|uniref:Calx-beta domain-containing protein n=1 Tax=Saccharothrix carnea TaxID=1280637 RepID=A0A2P8I086_SACCR|nr:Calx-beta domain-containing protein [Saccharothrix carnea]PSL51890.1 Calx-beta domain-containing protein [Saccharothrix carnea]